jgi:hypothetical protein
MKTAYSRLRVWKTLAFPLIMPTVFTGIVFGQLSPKNVSITVQVYNSAAMSTQILSTAEDEATRIFRQSGIDARWLNCSMTIAEAESSPICIAPCPSDRFAVRIVTQLPTDSAETSLGLAFGGIYSTIYSRRIDEYAQARIASRSQILAHAMAHEIGHLLLGPVPHTRLGIMRGRWTTEDLRRIAQGDLRFSREQSVVIRQAAMERVGRRKSYALE